MIKTSDTTIFENLEKNQNEQYHEQFKNRKW